MKKSLNINATRNGKKVSTSIGYVNPDVANSTAGTFAQMVNALTTNTFVNAEVVKKMDTTEEEQQSGGGGTLVLGKVEQDLYSEFDVMLQSDSDGNYILFRDSDDISEPAKFELRIYYTIE